MSTDDLADFWVHTVTVETYTGTGDDGDLFAAPVDVLGFMDGGTKVIRTATGELVVTSAPFYAPISSAALFVANSRVTYQGKQSRVFAVTIHDSGDLDLPDHVEVTLQ